MKIFLTTIFLVLIISTQAQRTYIKEWKRIDSLIEKSGLVKTALKEVINIHSSAKKENNDVQVIKALVYRMTLNDQLSDSGRYENIALLEKEITTAKEPAKSILHSIAGGSYWQYLQMNRWQFYDRSNTKGYDNKDISTWSIEQLYGKITDHFEKSLASSKLLMATKLDKFDPILIKGNARNLRPTLFDLLAFRALDYFRNDERYVTAPSYAFEISDSIAYSDAASFAKHKFISADSLSFHHKAIEIYQQLLSFHLSDAKPDALIDADIDRLQFVRNFGTHPDKDRLIKKTVEKIIAKYHSSAVTAPAIYQLAEWYMEKARIYDPLGDTTSRYMYDSAMLLCKKIIGFNVKSEAASNSKNILRQIEQQEISLKAELVNTRNDPFRVLVNYRNITNAYFRIIKFDRTVSEKLGRENWNDEYWKKVANLPAIKTYTYNLPATNDHQQHRVEIKIDSLPVGEYGILVSPVKDFSTRKKSYGTSYN